MKLKKWVKITLSVILLMVSVIIYINLGNTNSIYEILGWITIITNFVIIFELEGSK